jgi:molecular chaperone DnaK
MSGSPAMPSDPAMGMNAAQAMGTPKLAPYVVLTGLIPVKKQLEELGAKVPAESRTKIEGAVSNLEDKLKGDDKAAIEAALNNLMNAAGELQQAASAAGAAGAGAAGGATEGGAKKDDVIDAEYEVTDDGKKA